MSSTITDDIFSKGNTAVITGASSGIGKAAALEASKRGMHVWLIDVDESDLESAVQNVKDATICNEQKIQEVVADVSDFEALEKTATMIFNDPTTKSVHFLMNNAAVQVGGSALTTSMDIFSKVLSVNTLGPIHGCQAFVPFMKNKNQCGLIVNTGSKQGITMPPGNLTYNVSKAALKTWTEGLEHELMTQRLYSGGKLRAALLVPGWVNTSIALKESRARAKMEGETFDEDDVFFHEGKPAAGAWMSKEVIDFMFKELNDGKFYIICPDNDVDRETDNARMTWAMQDITQNRPPLSRWHPEWKDKFTDYLEAHRKEEK